MLRKEEYWHIVNLYISNTGSDIDWTYEHEWRLLGNMSFEYYEIQIIVEPISDYKNLISYSLASEPDVLKNINGIICLESLLN